MTTAAEIDEGALEAFKLRLSQTFEPYTDRDYSEAIRAYLAALPAPASGGAVAPVGVVMTEEQYSRTDGKGGRVLWINGGPSWGASLYEVLAPASGVEPTRADVEAMVGIADIMRGSEPAPASGGAVARENPLQIMKDDNEQADGVKNTPAPRLEITEEMVRQGALAAWGRLQPMEPGLDEFERSIRAVIEAALGVAGQ